MQPAARAVTLPGLHSFLVHVWESMRVRSREGREHIGLMFVYRHPVVTTEVMQSRDEGRVPSNLVYAEFTFTFVPLLTKRKDISLSDICTKKTPGCSSGWWQCGDALLPQDLEDLPLLKEP